MEPAVSARWAGSDDIPELVRLYREFEAEQLDLKRIWSAADGLPEPVETALKELLDDPAVVVAFGEIEGCGFGFAVGRETALQPQAGGERIGTIPYLFTEPVARGVGVGEALITLVLEELRSRGIRRFDALVLPGHRDAKNFFEANGFSARKIVMHHDPDK